MTFWGSPKPYILDQDISKYGIFQLTVPSTESVCNGLQASAPTAAMLQGKMWPAWSCLASQRYEAKAPSCPEEQSHMKTRAGPNRGKTTKSNQRRAIYGPMPDQTRTFIGPCEFQERVLVHALFLCFQGISAWNNDPESSQQLPPRLLLAWMALSNELIGVDDLDPERKIVSLEQTTIHETTIGFTVDSSGVCSMDCEDLALFDILVSLSLFLADLLWFWARFLSRFWDEARAREHLLWEKKD